MTKNRKRVSWNKSLENTNTENARVIFEEMLSHEMEENISKGRQEKKRPYINRHAQRKMKKKYYIWKRFKETNFGRDHDYHILNNT